MIESHIDVGQLIISGLIVIVGWFIANQIIDFKKKIERHDTILFSLTGSVQRLIGIYQGMINGPHNRRAEDEDKTPWPEV